MLSGSFRPIKPDPSTVAERLNTTELGDIAREANSIWLQTTRLFIWCTGLTSPEQVDAESLTAFEDLLGQLSHRFGTLPHHFEIDVATAIEASASRGDKPRSRATIKRHLARMRRIAKSKKPDFESRLLNGPVVELTPPEIACIGGYDDAAVLLLVERRGTIVDGHQILSRNELRAGGSETLAPDLPRAADETLVWLREHGRAFVATRHGHRVRVIEKFWAA